MTDRNREPFATVAVEYASTLLTHSDGDLWPCAWADDGHLYAANGDGAGFSEDAESDIVVSRLVGDPNSGIRGHRLASGRSVSPVWSDPTIYNCKPTGMVAVDGNNDGRDELYLAVQDLPFAEVGAFDKAPAASIVRSEDYGATWASTGEPMFTDHRFTTVMFLDFGQSNQWARSMDETGIEYVYAYGLDGNWRTSYSGVVDDPTALYLARVKAARILDRDSWQFFAGMDQNEKPVWVRLLDDRVPVLVDDRRLYVGQGPGTKGHTPIAQGGIVYNQPLRTFLYTSWTEFTFEFYAAPFPWGPWRLFHRQDFGPYPWLGPLSDHPKHGGYATAIPSKFLAPDGKSMWLQSNWFWRASAYTSNTYCFSLRRLQLEPYDDARARNQSGTANLAAPSNRTVAICENCRSGQLAVLNDGDHRRSEDSWNGSAKEFDFWGYTWPHTQTMDTLVFTSGPRDYVSGWFDPAPAVEARRNGVWGPVSELQIAPPYQCDASMTGFRKITFSFLPIEADGIRIIGRPANPEAYTTVAELEVFFRSAALH